MLLGTLGVSLLGNILIGKGINRARERHGQRVVRAGYGSSSQTNYIFLFPNSSIDKYWYKKILSKWI